MGTIFDTLEQMRRKPSMFIGCGDTEYRLRMEAIQTLIIGYTYALREHGIVEPGTTFWRDFTDFVKEKRGWRENAGPIFAILHFVKDDAKAWDTLWELVDEFRKTKEPSKVTPE